ncbi:hypothetical protein B9L19_15390 [Geobacillus thermocatenulatus]|uniref:Uncharacterized protein n=1 Tax=Geobacillus thermocatenulatus TaxID=33938 RepID=A0AA91TDD4_9BACL|nr:hypothetical protein B9L19_15390 [Geobacillus thermocatenulatus]
MGGLPCFVHQTVKKTPFSSCFSRRQNGTMKEGKKREGKTNGRVVGDIQHCLIACSYVFDWFLLA